MKALGQMFSTEEETRIAEALRPTLNERTSRYGPFESHARVSQQLQEVLQKIPKWSAMEPMHREALTMICHKIGRIMNGDESYDDNYRDIAGYAQLVVDILANRRK